MSAITRLPFGPPQAVSPVIRGARLILLIAGVMYGRGKQKRNASMQREWRVEKAKRKVVRDKFAELERARIATEERQAVIDMESGKLCKQKRYASIEKEWRVEEAKRKVVRDKLAKQERARLATEERQAVIDMENGKLFDRL